MRFLVAAVFLITAHSSFADCADVERFSTVGVTGFQEAVISVADLDAAVDTWRSVGGYDLLCRYDAGEKLAAFWNLQTTTRIETAVLQVAANRRGLVRLVKFHGTDQRRIRGGAMPWDTGGIFDLYVYVDDVDSTYAALRARGWQGYTEPVGYVLGPFDISESIMRGPNSESLVLMQRNAPPYDKAAFGADEGFGYPFNAALIVSDYDAHRVFFEEQLRWDKHLGGKSASNAPGENPMGLPLDLAQEAPRVFQAYANNPDSRTGSIQILAMPDVAGRSFADRAKAPNLGLLALRVPVSDLDRWRRDFESRGGKIAAEPSHLALPPYGSVRMLGVTAPEGAIIQFFEQR